MPGHPFNVGVTVMVPLIAEAEALVVVNAGTLPLPLAARPMPVLLLVQVKAAPVGVLLKLVATTNTPGHKVALSGTVTVGVGLTVIV